MDGTIEKSHGGGPAGPRGGAEAGERSEATNGGRSGAPRARRDPHMWFFKFELPSRKTSCYSAKKCEILSQIHVTQPKITMLYVWYHRLCQIITWCFVGPFCSLIQAISDLKLDLTMDAIVSDFLKKGKVKVEKYPRKNPIFTIKSYISSKMIKKMIKIWEYSL